MADTYGSLRLSKLNIKIHKNKTVTPHVFHHSTAMNLLQSGIDI